MNIDSDSRLSHTIFNTDHRYSSSPAPSMPSGGGGLMGGTSSSSTSSNSASEENEDEGDDQATQQSEEESDDPQEQLVSLSQAQFVNSDTTSIDADSDVQVSVEYLTERTPQTIQFELIATYNGEVENGPHVEGSINDGVATATINLAMHQGYYNSENKTDTDKVEYSFLARCPEDETEISGDTVLLPDLSQAVDIIEVIDNSFNHNSATPCLCNQGMLVKSIATCFKHLEEWPDKEIITFGHTDRSGEEEYNFNLSEKRAKAIKALLSQDVELWKEVTSDQSGVLDYQTTLKSFSELYGWPTDPGELDGADGENTQNALKAFQNEYNKKYDQSLGCDGIIGPNSWAAIFEVILKRVAESADNATERVNVVFNADTEGVYPCGEMFPIDQIDVDGYVSSANRRVDVLFYDRPNQPTLPTPSATMDTTEVLVYATSATAITIVAIAEGSQGSKSLLLKIANVTEPQRFELKAGDESIEGETDAEGNITVDVPSNTSKGELIITQNGREKTFNFEIKMFSDGNEGAQERLRNLGLYGGSIDGIFGILSFNAIVAFQTIHDLQIDGIVGPETEGKLNGVVQ